MKKKIEILGQIEKINYITPPSTVVLVSTVSKDGVRNLAPFAQFTIASSKPPMLALGISPKSDTYRNICDTNQFVVGIPTKDILAQLVKAADKIEDEFAHAGLRAYESSRVVPPKIAECCINIECELAWLKESGNHFIICGNALAADIDEELARLANDNIGLRTGFDSIYHIGNRSNFGIGFAEIRNTEKPEKLPAE